MSRSSIAPFAVSKLFRGSSQGSDLLIGRENELKALDAAWSGSERKNIVTIVAWGGVGKTSLAARWAANTLAKVDHAGVERYFDWSFYSQGTRTEGDATGADKAASADIFVKQALEFFGDPDLAVSNAGAWQKGERLARLIAEQRTLLILDGLEPLQDAKSGELHDEALRALLRGLAANNHGLCVVTTRQQLPELNNWHSTTAPEWQLAKLSKEAGADLLKKLGVKGTPAEREQLAADLKGHALSITLLGKYLVEAHAGDIGKRDLVSLTEADYEETSGHAFQVIEAYERWLEKDYRHVELAILRLLGLFDRPATPDCLAALRQTPTIPGLTDAVASLTDAQWNLAAKRLVKLGLVEEQPWDQRRVVGYTEELARQAMEAGRQNRGFPLGEPQPFSFNVQYSTFNSLDAHPLIREYFGQRLRENAADAWLAAQSRLFEHLRDSAPYWPEGLDGIERLYQAVAHGCLAGLYQQTCDEVYVARILRGTSGPHSFYSSFKLGAMGADLAAIGCFFVALWTRPAEGLTETDKGWLLNEAATRLRARGRFSESREPMQISTDMDVVKKDWAAAAISTNNLSELELMLGDVASAAHHAEQSITFADRSGDAYQVVVNSTTYADTLHQVGREEEARTRFEEAEAMQAQCDPRYPVLYSIAGFRFCDLLLADIERAAWRILLENVDSVISAGALLSLAAKNARPARPEGIDRPTHSEALRVVNERATLTLEWCMRESFPLSIALDHLTLGRSALYCSVLKSPSCDIQNSGSFLHLDAAVHNLRLSGRLDYILSAFVTRAWLRTMLGKNPDARADLDEAQHMAERGPMPLHLADVHLHRARLFFREDLDSARENLRQARTLIEKHGYLHRMPELEDAEKVILAAK